MSASWSGKLRRRRSFVSLGLVSWPIHRYLAYWPRIVSYTTGLAQPPMISGKQPRRHATPWRSTRALKSLIERLVFYRLPFSLWSRSVSSDTYRVLAYLFPSDAGFLLGHQTDKPMYEFFSTVPERGRRFANAMTAFSEREGGLVSHVTDNFPWGELGSGKVVDVSSQITSHEQNESCRAH